jgi:hypothetical protein
LSREIEWINKKTKENTLYYACRMFLLYAREPVLMEKFDSSEKIEKGTCGLLSQKLRGLELSIYT